MPVTVSHVIIRRTRASEHRRVIMSIERCYWIYILASAIGGTPYIGVTNNLVRRVYEHKMGLADGFTKKYRVHPVGLFRTIRRRCGRDPPRKASQKVESGVESSAH
jgi:hypothetical protein